MHVCIHTCMHPYGAYINASIHTPQKKPKISCMYVTYTYPYMHTRIQSFRHTHLCLSAAQINSKKATCMIIYIHPYIHTCIHTCASPPQESSPKKLQSAAQWLSMYLTAAVISITDTFRSLYVCMCMYVCMYVCMRVL